MELFLDLHKGLPLWSGSSAASTAAAAVAAALEAGAFGCTISGAGPTAVAVIDAAEKGEEIGEKMVEAFMN
uniref:GHMP kinase C-terminal domain-containing protein n=1 Tax=Brassica oleracea var. oleracea TaxID=109376 RepID=A0A0D3DA28_BRAOL